MCNGDKKPISHVTPSNGANTRHARTPTLKKNKRFIFNLETRFLREKKNQTVGFCTRMSYKGAKVLNNVLYHYEVHLWQVSWLLLGTAMLEGSEDFRGKEGWSSYLICSLWLSLTCWILVTSLITRTRIAILIFTSNNRNTSNLIFVYCPSRMV